MKIKTLSRLAISSLLLSMTTFFLGIATIVLYFVLLTNSESVIAAVGTPAFIATSSFFGLSMITSYFMVISQYWITFNYKTLSSNLIVAALILLIPFVLTPLVIFGLSISYFTKIKKHDSAFEENAHSKDFIEKKFTILLISFLTIFTMILTFLAVFDRSPMLVNFVGQTIILVPYIPLMFGSFVFATILSIWKIVHIIGKKKEEKKSNSRLQVVKTEEEGQL